MKILLIDDEQEILDAVEKILIKDGFEVDTAATITEGKSKINEFYYDLVISDIMLPHWGGFDLVDAIKDNPFKKNTPVIIITGMDKDILENSHIFADLCLPKPFTRNQLLEAVHLFVKN
ncbi:MAG: response regulator transcription factor [Bacteroidetes bacterium]|nr:response regulator transcription factor [Bacteroidota bacterium]